MYDLDRIEKHEGLQRSGVGSVATEGGAGIAKLGQVLVKGGATIFSKLMYRSAFSIVARMNWTKLLSTGAALAFTPELKAAVELALREVVTLPLNAEIKQCGAEVIEQIMRKDGFTRTLCTIRDVIEAIASKPMLKRLAVEMPSGAGEYFRHVALMLHLLDDKADSAVLRAFIDLADSKLVREGTDGKAYHWMEDFLRSCRGSAPEMASRPPLTTYEDWQKTVLKSLLDDKDVWKSPPIGATTRGVIIETHLANTSYKGWTWNSIGEAVDFTKDGVAVQLKSIETESSENALKAAIRQLSEHSNASFVDRILDVRSKAGVDIPGIQSRLREYAEAAFLNQDIPNRVRVSLSEYSF